MQRLAQDNYLSLYDDDECRFSLVSNVPRAWQAHGKPIALLATRGPGINVSGFLRHDSAHFHAFATQQCLASEDIILFFNDFCQEMTPPTVVVLDNASTHRSAAFKAQIPYWESQGLTLFYLPPYCPELNRIEILWRCCKHQWLDLKAYAGFPQLQHELRTMLNKIGNVYKVNFAQEIECKKCKK